MVDKRCSLFVVRCSGKWLTVDVLRFKVQGSRFDLSEIEGFTVHDSRLTVNGSRLTVVRCLLFGKQLMVDVF